MIIILIWFCEVFVVVVVSIRLLFVFRKGSVVWVVVVVLLKVIVLLFFVSFGEVCSVLLLIYWNVNLLFCGLVLFVWKSILLLVLNEVKVVNVCVFKILFSFVFGFKIGLRLFLEIVVEVGFGLVRIFKFVVVDLLLILEIIRVLGEFVLRLSFSFCDVIVILICCVKGGLFLILWIMFLIVFVLFKLIIVVCVLLDMVILLSEIFLFLFRVESNVFLDKIGFRLIRFVIFRDFLLNIFMLEMLEEINVLILMKELMWFLFLLKIIVLFWLVKGIIDVLDFVKRYWFWLCVLVRLIMCWKIFFSFLMMVFWVELFRELFVVLMVSLWMFWRMFVSLLIVVLDFVK